MLRIQTPVTHIHIMDYTFMYPKLFLDCNRAIDLFFITERSATRCRWGLKSLYVKLLLDIYVMGTLYDARELLGRVLAC